MDDNKAKFVWVVKQKNGNLVVGCASNAAKQIAYFNSGWFKETETKERTIEAIIGVKPVNENRTLMGVYEKFKAKYGDKVRLLK